MLTVINLKLKLCHCLVDDFKCKWQGNTEMSGTISFILPGWKTNLTWRATSVYQITKCAWEIQIGKSTKYTTITFTNVFKYTTNILITYLQIEIKIGQIRLRQFY